MDKATIRKLADNGFISKETMEAVLGEGKQFATGGVVSDSPVMADDSAPSPMSSALAADDPRNTKIVDPAEALKLPAGSPVVGGDILGLGAIATAAKDAVSKGVDIADKDRGVNTNSRSAATFDETQDETKASKSGLVDSNEAAKESIQKLAQDSRNIAAPASFKSAGVAQNLEQENLNNYKKMQESVAVATQASQSAQAKLEALTQKAAIDPMRYIDQMGVGQKTVSAIAMMLGGMGAGIVGGSNPAQDILNSRIANDIDAQKKEYEKKLFDISTQMGISTQNLNIAQLSASALSLGTQTVMSGASAYVDHTKQGVSDKNKQADADALKFTLDQQKLKGQLDYDSIVKGLVSSQDTRTLSILTEFMKQIGINPISPSKSADASDVRGGPTRPPGQSLSSKPLHPTDTTAPNHKAVPDVAPEKKKGFLDKLADAAKNTFGGSGP